MVTIPDRILAIWQTPLDLETCPDQIGIHKLQCSNCLEMFSTEESFGIHIADCMQHEDKNSTHYQMHLHANRHLLYTHHVALFCGPSRQPEYLECGICKETFPDKEAIRRHIRICSRFNNDYAHFHGKMSQLLGNMLHSHEKLGQIFQKFESDPRIIQIRENRNRDRELVIERDEQGRHLIFNELAEHFVEDYQDFIFAVTVLTNDAFIRYVKNLDTDRTEKAERQRIEQENRERANEARNIAQPAENHTGANRKRRAPAQVEEEEEDDD